MKNLMKKRNSVFDLTHYRKTYYTFNSQINWIHTGTIATSTRRMVVAPIGDFGHFKVKFNVKRKVELQIHIYSYV